MSLVTHKFYLPYNPKLVERAKEFRKNLTKAEKIFWYQFIKKDPLNKFKWMKQRPIDHYIVDFYCAELKLVIEIDGEIHDQTKEYDEERDVTLSGYGLRVLRLTNDEVVNEATKVLKKIEDLSLTPPLLRGAGGIERRTF